MSGKRYIFANQIYKRKDKQNGNKRRIFREDGQFVGQIARCRKTEYRHV
jgi:hypothetical protein